MDSAQLEQVWLVLHWRVVVVVVLLLLFQRSAVGGGSSRVEQYPTRCPSNTKRTTQEEASVHDLDRKKANERQLRAASLPTHPLYRFFFPLSNSISQRQLIEA